MGYHVELQQADRRILAVVRDRATIKELPIKIPAHCGTVWNFVRSSGIKSTGHMIAVYFDKSGEPELTDGDFAIEVGAEVLASFPDAPPVFCSETPAGKVATTVHIGPYNKLSDAHVAVRTWCKANGHAITGTNWEFYGHGTDDPAKIRTDVFYQLR